MTKKWQKRKWTQEEDNILIENYFELGPTKIRNLYFPNENVSRIKERGHILGLKAKKGLFWIRRQNVEDVSYFTEVKTGFAAYFLGFLWADGYVNKKSNNIVFKIVEDDFNEIKDKILKTLKSWRYYVYNYNYGDIIRQRQSSLEISHKGFHDFLVENDYLIKSGASANKILSKIPEKYKHYWWRGYFDGDGSFTFNKPPNVKINLASCYEQNWDFVEELKNDIDFEYKICKRVNQKSKNSIIIVEKEDSIKKFMNYILKGRKFGLIRKYNKYYKYRGVSKKSNGAWCTQIHKGKSFRFTFGKTKKDEILAAKKYDEMAKQLFGDKAYLNFK
jgi:hypothetical protein